MGHDHAHGGTAAGRHRGRLAIALGLTFESGCWQTPAQHAPDAGGLALALFAIRCGTAGDPAEDTVTSGLDSMSGHVAIDDMSKAQTVLRAARRVMKEKFGIDHVTIQSEDERLRSEEAELRGLSRLRLAEAKSRPSNAL
jgi:hypothetical protein